MEFFFLALSIVYVHGACTLTVKILFFLVLFQNKAKKKI